MTAPRRADAIVVGLGAIGSAACMQLAARGASVIGIDQFEPPHEYGSTHGETRITRVAVGEGPEYVPLVRRAHELWRVIEERASVALLTQCGGVTLGSPGSAFLRQTRAVAAQFGIEHSNLSSAEVRKRFPVLAVEDRTEAYYEPAAGYVRPEAAVRAQLGLARRDGAELRLGERVQRWEARAGDIRVRTDRGTYEAGQLVLCVGPWLPELFAPGRTLFAIYRQLLYWFPIRSGYEQFSKLPVFVWDLERLSERFDHLLGFYGFPAIDGRDGGIKVATEIYRETTAPDGMQHPATAAEISEMHRLIGTRLPRLGSEPLRTVSCLYTRTVGGRFVIDRHPDHDSVLIVSACSGHGFKHSPAIGEAVAQLVTDGTSEIDLRPFSFSRAELRG